jgi:hypothetical protein
MNWILAGVTPNLQEASFEAEALKNFRCLPDCLKSHDKRRSSSKEFFLCVVHINQNRGSTYPKPFNITRAKTNSPGMDSNRLLPSKQGAFP